MKSFLQLKTFLCLHYINLLKVICPVIGRNRREKSSRGCRLLHNYVYNYFVVGCFKASSCDEHNFATIFSFKKSSINFITYYRLTLAKC